MAENHYPSVVLLDNENNPITPLVDIHSVYENVLSKDDAGVLVGADGPATVEDLSDVTIGDDGELYEDATMKKPLYFIVGIEIRNRRLILKRVKASNLLNGVYENQAWEGLLTKDDEILLDANEQELQVKKDSNQNNG